MLKRGHFIGRYSGFLAEDTHVSWYRSWASEGELRQTMNLFEIAKFEHGDGSSYGQDTVSVSVRQTLTKECLKHKDPLGITYYVTLCPHEFDPFGEVCFKITENRHHFPTTGFFFRVQHASLGH